MDSSPLFRFVMEVLVEERDAEMRGSDTFKKDKKITSALKAFSKHSSEEDASPIPYSRPHYRCAYMYKYFTSRTYFISYQLNGLEQTFQSFVTARKGIRICSIGGGPGTDFAGILLFLQQQDWWVPELTGVRIHGTILDSCPRWDNTFRRIIRRIDPYMTHLGHVQYLKHDFFEGINNIVVEKSIREADLLTMVTFLSEIIQKEDRYRRRLKEIFSKMKPGSMLLVIDYQRYELEELLDGITKECHLIESEQISNVDSKITDEEELKEMIVHVHQFGKVFPEISTKLTVGLWIKDPDFDEDHALEDAEDSEDDQTDNSVVASASYNFTEKRSISNNGRISEAEDDAEEEDNEGTNEPRSSLKRTRTTTDAKEVLLEEGVLILRKFWSSRWGKFLLEINDQPEDWCRLAESGNPIPKIPLNQNLPAKKLKPITKKTKRNKRSAKRSPSSPSIKEGPQLFETPRETESTRNSELISRTVRNSVSNSNDPHSSGILERTSRASVSHQRLIGLPWNSGHDHLIEQEITPETPLLAKENYSSESSNLCCCCTIL